LTYRVGVWNLMIMVPHFDRIRYACILALCFLLRRVIYVENIVVLEHSHLAPGSSIDHPYLGP
jgi:hypothetical protein